MRQLKNTLVVAVCAFLGGIVSEQFLHPKDSYAEQVIEATKDIMGSSHTIYDKDGSPRWSITTASGSPFQSFVGQNGMTRMQAGLYPGNEVAGSDAGVPMVAFSDSRGKQRLLLRLAQGGNQSPIMVMKDSKGKDRILMGNSFTDEGEEPFLVYFDKYGVKHNVFGNF